MEWQNWAGNIRFDAKRMAQPTSTEEVQELLKTSNGKVRCFGTGHSWSALIPTDDLLIDTSKLNRVLSIDREKNQATIQAGAKLKDLNLELWESGYAFSNLGSIAEQSLAGAISTATHGSGIGFQILGSMVESFKLVKADGEVLEVSRKENSELYHLSVISLGSLGIITEMTINVVPKFQLRERSGIMDFEEVCDNILDWVKEHDHIKMWWFPHTDKMMVYRYERTEEPVNDTWFRQKLMDEWVSVYFYRLMLWWGNRKPTRRRTINSKVLTPFLADVDRIERSYKVFNVPEPPIHRETEWAFDINHAPTLFREYKRMVESKGHLMNFIQEIRFVKGDDFALSPCHGRDSVYIGCYNADNRGWDELLVDFEEHIGIKYNGRPHWGKEFNVGTDYLRSVYPKWDDFLKLRSDMDANGRFMNGMLEGLFG
ncbi:MAG: FAD-binding protein [Flavobacteriales bacterium]|nr:FAD-binding protein [Flavobacteriales bacterium]